MNALSRFAARFMQEFLILLAIGVGAFSVILILLLLAHAAHGQTAQVIELKAEDAARAQSLYAQKSAIDKEIAELTDAITTRYLRHPTPGVHFWGANNPRTQSCTYDPATSDYRCVDQTWGNGFEFDEGFRFIVPVPSAPSSSNISCPSIGLTHGDLSPAETTTKGLHVAN